MNANALALTDAERRTAERINPAAASALAVSDAAGGLAFANAGQLLEFAKMMAVANSGIRKHLRGNPGACLAICTQAVEWGLSPFAVANKSYFVNDQIAFESQLLQAVILKRAPIKGRLKFDFSGTGDKRVCRAWARLAEDPEEVVEYVSPEFGKIQPKNSPLWKSDPDQQQAYYSGRALCRRHFPDVLLGVYADDELDLPTRGPDTARDVSPSRQLSDRLDALAGTAAAPIEEIDPEPPADLPEIQANGDEPFAEERLDGGQRQPAEIDRSSPDFALGYEGGIQGMPKKGLSEAVRSDPSRLAHYEAGRDAGAAQAAKGDE